MATVDELAQIVVDGTDASTYDAHQGTRTAPLDAYDAKRLFQAAEPANIRRVVNMTATNEREHIRPVVHGNLSNGRWWAASRIEGEYRITWFVGRE